MQWKRAASPISLDGWQKSATPTRRALSRDLSRRMWRVALLLFIATAIPVDRSFGSDSDLVRLLDRTAWTDIGPGRQLGSLTSTQVAELASRPNVGPRG